MLEGKWISIVKRGPLAARPVEVTFGGSPMKLSQLILGCFIALAGFATVPAHAENRDLPLPIETVKGTKILSINDLDHWEKGLVERILMRSDFNSHSRPALDVIAVVADGKVHFRERTDLKALSKSMLVYLSSTRMCDLALYGECVVYDKRSNDDLHVLVIGTQILRDGSVEVLQSSFNSRVGRGTSASLYSLAERLRDAVDLRSAIFTRAPRNY
jgi:hypothetical protein